MAAGPSVPNGACPVMSAKQVLSLHLGLNQEPRIKTPYQSHSVAGTERTREMFACWLAGWMSARVFPYF